MSNAVSDSELVARARADPAEFAALYGRYLVPVFRYARVRVGSEDVAEDIASAVFADALASLPRYRERGRFAAWLFTIARRKVLDHYRRTPRDLVAGHHADEPDAVEPVDAARLSDLAALQIALAGLPPDRREALELRFFGDLDVRQVAAVMNRNEGAVKMLVHRGLAQLRRTMAEPGSAPGGGPAARPLRGGGS